MLILDFCNTSAGIWRLVGLALMIFKICIPILIIVLGMVDLGKAVVGSKDDDIKKAAGALARRAIAGIVIFFIPTIIIAIFDVAVDKTELDNQWKSCLYVVSHPSKYEEVEKCVDNTYYDGKKCVSTEK